MEKKFIFLVISCLFCFYANAQSRKDNFMKALKAKEMAKAESMLKAWDFADANDPELYIAYFNFYTVKSMDAALPATKGYEKNYAKQALDFITEGITRFPTRFDMRIGKISMLREMNDYQAYVEEIMKMIVDSDKIKNNWKGVDFTMLDYPDEMFYGAVLDCQEFLFMKNDPSLYSAIFRISDEMLKYYPKHVQTRINNSTVYIAQKEYDKALAELLKGKEFEPTNAILLYNIAYVYNQKGDKANAKKYYELTVKHCTDKEDKLKEAAQKRMEALK